MKNQKQILRDVEETIPYAYLFSRTASELTPEAIDKITKITYGHPFYEKMSEIAGKEVPQKNPFILEGEEAIAKITNPKLKTINEAWFFGSCFYNSQGHSLEEMTGVFVSQGVRLKNKRAANRDKRNLIEAYILKDDKKQKKVYSAFLQKDKTVIGINMYQNISPTPEIEELVDHLYKKGFSLTEFYPSLPKLEKKY
ncbi:MAG: hypothetical protein KKA79_08860 [Nanoarchaeota archaeon]|nr:hypothetical protein [Nanoarchaeota archaeon]MCG2717930.1 hypothetical protein [Nanoarchaeota archaeon]